MEIFYDKFPDILICAKTVFPCPQPVEKPYCVLLIEYIQFYFRDGEIHVQLISGTDKYCYFSIISTLP